MNIALSWRGCWCYGALLADAQNWQAGTEPLARSLSLLRPLDDPPALALTLQQLGLCFINTDKESEGLPNLKESWELYQTLGDSYHLARTLRYLGHVSKNRGEYGEARRLYHESVEFAEAVGNRVQMYWSLAMLGELDVQEGKDQEGIAWYEQALARRAKSVFRPASLVGLALWPEFVINLANMTGNVFMLKSS